MYKIFVVEDDAVIARAVVEHIASWGWEARKAEDLTRVMEEFTAFAPHLVLLDIGLPFRNGYHWCAEIRKLSQVPIVFLSSASDNMNVVMAMNMGGDDFIAKPFDLEVLAAKVQALLRRTYDFGASAPLLGCRGAEQKGKTVSRETLMRKLWETDSFVDENTLTVNMARLRRKLEGIGLTDFIRTKKGLGYLIEG